MLFFPLPTLKENTLLSLDNTTVYQLDINNFVVYNESIQFDNTADYTTGYENEVFVAYPTVLPLIRGIFNLTSIAPDKLSIISDATFSLDFTYALDTGAITAIEVKLNELSVVDNSLSTNFITNLITLGVNSSANKVYVGKVKPQTVYNTTKLLPIRNVKLDLYEALFSDKLEINLTSDISNNKDLYLIGFDYKNSKSYLFDTVSDKLYVITNESILEVNISDANNKLLPVYINDAKLNQILSFLYQSDTHQITVSIFDATENLPVDTGDSFVVYPVVGIETSILDSLDISKDVIDSIVLGFDTDNPDIAWIVFINYTKQQLIIIASIFNQTENRFSFGYYTAVDLSQKLNQVFAVYPPYILINEDSNIALLYKKLVNSNIALLSLYVANFDNGQLLKVGERLVSDSIDYPVYNYIKQYFNQKLIVSQVGCYLLPKLDGGLELIL